MAKFITRQDIIADMISLSQSNLNLDEIDQNNLSTYGTIIQVMAKTMEDTLNINVTRSQNYIPELASNETIVKETSKLREVSIATATPSEAIVLLSIVKEDILNKGSKDSNGIVSFYIDKRSSIINNTIPYSLVSDILIRGIPSKTGYLFSASYVNGNVSDIQAYDDYLENTPVLNVIASIHQVKYNIQEDIVLDAVEFTYSGIGFEYEDLLSGFDVYYRIGINGSYTKINSKYYLIDAKNEKSDCLYYNDDVPSMLYILNNPLMNLSTNTYIKVELKETLGKDGDIPLGLGETSFELYKDTSYTYAGVTIYADIIDSFNNGNNGDTLGDIQYKMIRAKTYRENITTDTDIISYINDKSANVQIVKKRIDLIDRLHYIYTLLRNGNEIMPATTKNLLLGEVDFDSIDEITNIKHLNSNNKFIVGLDDNARKTNIDSTDERCLCLPFLTVFDSSNIPYYYFQTINEDYGLVAIANNINNPYQAISRSMNIKRNQFDEEKKYIISTTMGLNTSSDNKWVDASANIIDTDSIRAYAIFKNGVETVAYCKLSLSAYDPSTRIFTLDGSFQTDDFITDEKKIHIVNGLYEVKTGTPFKGLIDYANIEIGVHFFCKSDPEIEYNKLIGAEIYNLLTDIQGYDYMNAYNNPNKLANLLIELNSFSRSNATIYKNGADDYDVIEGQYRSTEIQNKINIDEFDYIRDYVILAIDRVIQRIGIDYTFDSSGITLTKAIPVNTLVTYVIFKNYDDKTLLKFERDRHVIVDNVLKFKLPGYSMSTDMIQLTIKKYGVLLPNEFSISEDSYVTLNVPMANDDIVDIIIFKNYEIYPLNIILEDKVTYQKITNGYYDLILPEGLDDYCIEKDFVEIRTSEDGRPLTVNRDFYLTYNSHIRLQSRYITEGATLYLKIIKDYKGVKNIVVGNITPPDDLIVVPDFNQITDTIELFHKDIKMEEGIDYIIKSDDSIELVSFTITSRLEITYRLFKNISLISYDVDKEYVRIRGKYVPDRLNIDNITIPNFDNKSDSIQLIRNNLILVNSIDFVIEDTGNIRFLLSPLMIGDTLEYKITKVYDITNKLRVIDKIVEITETTTTITVPEIENFEYLDVAYCQTPMRILEDYRIENRNQIVFIKSSLYAGDIINLRFYKTENVHGDIIQILHESVTITDNNTTYVPLTKYDYEKDTLLTVNYNQTALIPNLNYDNSLNGMDISTYVFDGMTSPIVVKGFDKTKDFIRVFVNNKILIQYSDYNISNNNEIVIPNTVFGDNVTVVKYSNMLINSYATMYTYRVSIQQNAQRYIPIYDNNVINAIYYNGNVLRRNIDYTYDSSNIVLYNVTTKKDDIVLIESINIINSVFSLATSYYTYSSGMPINVPGLNKDADHLSVNYNGRILFKDIDYTINPNGTISLINLRLLDGDILHYTMIKNYYNIFSDYVNGISMKGLTLNTGDIIDVSIIKTNITDFEVHTDKFIPSVDDYSGKIFVDGYSYDKDYIIVNFNDTILNEEEHYRRNIDNSISFIELPLNRQDTVYFILFKNVRETLDIYTGYVSGPENLMVIPGFNKLYDKLELMVDGFLLREVSDYTIDVNNKIIFKNFLISTDSIAHYKVFKYYKGDEKGRYTVKMSEVPFIQYDYLKKYVNEVYDEIVKIKNTYSSLVQIITGFDINLKFTSTYGRSKHIYIMDELLNNINPYFKFRVYGRDINVAELKEFIVQYFRDTYISDNTIFISNICRAIENNFQEVRGITYLGVDNFNSTYQKIFYKKPDLSNKTNLLAYVPECLNILDISIEVEEN